MLAKVNNNKIIYNGKEYEIGELFTSETIEFANNNASNYYFDSCVVNELFGSYVIPCHNIDVFIKKNKIKKMDITKAGKEIKPLVYSCAKKCDIQVIGNNNRLNGIISKFNYIGAFLFLFYKQIVQKKNIKSKVYDSILIARSKATKSKFSRVEEIDKLFEDSPGVGSLYQQLGRKNRICLLFSALSLSKKYNKEMIEALKKFGLDLCINDAKLHYSKRLLHTAFYYKVVNEYIKNTNYKTLYTGNNLDRFAYNEEIIAKQHGLRLIVIPHGIEYGYRFPKCFVGDVFYSCSKNAANELNKLYCTNKFVFSDDISNKVFKINNSFVDNTKIRVVFFTEPREFQVNIDIINSIYPILKNNGIELYLKLHPVDDPNNYRILFDKGIQEIKDFNSSICGNICVSRKSTTLLEAVYNNSESIAILTNEKDKCVFNSFPSLQDERIKHFYNPIEAADYIVSIYNRLNNEEK